MIYESLERKDNVLFVCGPHSQAQGRHPAGAP